MPAPTTPALSEDHIDELLYLARIGDRADFASLLAELAKAHHVDPPALLLPAVRDPETGNGVLHMAAANGKMEILTFILPTTTSTTTSSSSSSPLTNTPNKAGNTPLHYAALNGQLEAVKLLLAAGADASVANGAGWTAAHEAERAEKEDVAALLVKEAGVVAAEGINVDDGGGDEGEEHGIEEGRGVEASGEGGEKEGGG